jgi:uncharacterized membrane protein
MLWPAGLLGDLLPLQLEFYSLLEAAGLFALLSLPIIYLGLRSLNGLGPVRRWVAIGARLVTLFLIVLILGGARWQRQHRNVEVVFIRDLSDSTSYVKELPADTLRKSQDQYMAAALADRSHRPGDRLGVIAFARSPMVESLPSYGLNLGSGAAQRPGDRTDVAAAIQLAMASLSSDAMHRMVLMWDGNATEGDLGSALATAAAQKIPIDVMPLRYRVPAAVMMERFVAPSWKGEKNPISLQVVLRNAGDRPLPGKLVILHQGETIDLDADTPGVQGAMNVVLKPGLTPVQVKVPPLGGGVHAFRAVFELSPQQGPGPAPTVVTPAMDAFTIVEGRGKVLYVDNAPGDSGLPLARALAQEGITVERVRVNAVPRTVLELQNYEAIILANVPAGADGLDALQDAMLAKYVHDTGGGLVMIGGPETFGAGGWQGSQVEKILPVSLDVPAQRQVGKGALVLVMHACEMGEGNYWGKQCALQAAKALSDHDEIGVISYGWNPGGANWDFQLAPRGNGEKVTAAIQAMQHGDMPSFQECLELALKGRDGSKGLAASDAQHKHVIIISDGDPSPPTDQLLQEYVFNKVSISTISVYPHTGMNNMDKMAPTTGGRAYGPINSKPDQLPQIFIKEARIVRRTLIFEDREGIRLLLRPSLSDVVQGLGDDLPPVHGMVLTSRRNDPLIDYPIVGGKASDPVLAHWQTGLGKSAVFTSDATSKWASRWVASRSYGKFWAQVVRSVARPPMSRDLDVQTVIEGGKMKILAEAVDRESKRLNFLSVTGQVISPDMQVRDVRLSQVGPGRYEAVVDADAAGAYSVRLNYVGPKGENGWQVAGAAANTMPELRDLESNEANLKRVAEATGGRLLDPFEPATAGFFSREGLKRSASPLPIWDILLMLLLPVFLMDVAIRRIAWNWQAIRSYAAARVAGAPHREISRSESVDALKRLKSQPKPQEPAAAASPAPTKKPDAGRKFEAAGVKGDITDVLAGASEQAPAASKPATPQPGKGGAGDHTSGLLAAKRRARQQMDESNSDTPPDAGA